MQQFSWLILVSNQTHFSANTNSVHRGSRAHQRSFYFCSCIRVAVCLPMFFLIKRIYTQTYTQVALENHTITFDMATTGCLDFLLDFCLSGDYRGDVVDCRAQANTNTGRCYDTWFNQTCCGSCQAIRDMNIGIKTNLWTDIAPLPAGQFPANHQSSSDESSFSWGVVAHW